MKSSKFINDILKDFDASISGLATLIEVNPATIHRWINDEMEISQDNIDRINEISSIIKTISASAHCQTGEIIKTLVTLKKSPLWKGWDHTIQMLSGADISLQNEDYLKKHLLQNPNLLEDGLRPLKRIPSGLDIDALFKDKSGNHIAVKYYKKTVATDEYGKIKILLSTLSGKLGKKNKLILVGPRFINSFVEVSANEKNLKLLQLGIDLKPIQPIGLF
tara:strand:+ start:180552 stop:181211 length:660 start_codon:yes stop_codon:yes gene_type:complete